MAQTEAHVTDKTEINNSIKEPSKYKILYLNDNVTTVEFVISSLVTIFGYSEDQGEELAFNIHTNGSAVVAVLPYEIAEQKGIEVTMFARNAGFPLQVRLEIDE